MFDNGERWVYQCQTCECLVSVPRPLIKQCLQSIFYKIETMLLLFCVENLLYLSCDNTMHWLINFPLSVHVPRCFHVVVSLVPMLLSC